MYGQIDKAFTRATFALDTKAVEHRKMAVKYKPTDYICFAECLYYYHSITHWDTAEDDDTTGQAGKHMDMPDVPTNGECFEHIIQLARDLDGRLRDDKHTNFIHSLMEFTYDVDDYHLALSNAARETGELEWLQERYRAAISAAKKDLQPVTAACLNLCLADILYKYGDGDRAMRIWESVGLESGQTTRVESEISYARWQALNKLGMHCITRAFEDESQADRWVEKMENIIARSHGRRGAAFSGLDSVPPNEIALYLSAWYCKKGHVERAHGLAKPHVKDALVILSDDDPSNDSQGYISLANAFIAVNDDINALAVYHSFRPMKRGIAVLAPNTKASHVKGMPDAAKAEEKAEQSETQDWSPGMELNADKDEGEDDTDNESEDDDEDNDDGGYWTCDGLCVRSFNNFDNAVICRMGCALFCQSCYALLLADRIPFRVCSRAHEHMKVPVLATRFKEGELVVDGKVVTLEEWKKSIKKSWSL